MGNCPIVNGLRYEGGALMDAAANEIERLRKQLAETESHLESLQNRFEQVTAENEQLRERNLLLKHEIVDCMMAARHIRDDMGQQ